MSDALTNLKNDGWHETRTLHVRWRADRVLEVRVKDEVDFSLADSLHNQGIFDELIGSNPRPVPQLAHMGRLQRASPEARRFFAKDPSVGEMFSAVALVANNRVARVIGNVLIGLNKPNIPTRLFTDEAEALTWLLTRAGG